MSNQSATSRSVFRVSAIAVALGAVVLAMTVRSSHAQTVAQGTPTQGTPTQGAAGQGASDGCLTKPGGAAGPGLHWYYRSDRANNRRCWFLAQERDKAPTAQVAPNQAAPSQAAPNQATPSSQATTPNQATPNPTPRRARSAVRPSPEPRAESPAPESQPEPTIEGADALPEPQAAVPMLTGGLLAAPTPRVELPLSSAAAEPESASPATGSADASAPAEEEMPLIWPVLTAADRAAVDASGGWSGHVLAQVFALLAAALTLAAIFFYRKVSRGDYRAATPPQRDVAANARGARERVTPVSAAVVKPLLANSSVTPPVRKPQAATRRDDLTRRPAPYRNVGREIERPHRNVDRDVERPQLPQRNVGRGVERFPFEDPEAEASLQRLLQSWRRDAA